jgi:hypothetical protein
MSNLTLPEEELEFEEKAKPYSNLGPNYFAAQTIAERFLKNFAVEHFEPLVKHFTEKFRDELWTDITSWLLADTESNLALEIRNRVDRSVNALLEGNPNYIKQYVMGQYNDEEIRKAIARHIPKELQDLRVLDLEKQVASLTESLKYAQQSNRY